MKTKVITWHTYPTLDKANAEHLALAWLVKGATYAWTFPSETVFVKACELAREVGPDVHRDLTISLTLNKRFRWWEKDVVPGTTAVALQLDRLNEHLYGVIYPTLERIGVSVGTVVVEAEWARSIEGQDPAIARVHNAFDSFLRKAFPRADIMWLLNNEEQSGPYKVTQDSYAVGTLYNMADLSDTDRELSATRDWAVKHDLKLAMWFAPNYQKDAPDAGHVFHLMQRLRIVGNMCQDYGVDIVGTYAHAANWPPGYLDALAAFLEGLRR